MPSVWCIRADDGKYARHFLEGGYAGIGWMPGIDLSLVRSRDELYTLYKQEHPEDTSKSVIGQQVGQIARFLLEIQAGDFVIVPSEETEVLYYGVVGPDPSYYHAPGTDGVQFRQRRRVHWSKTSLERSSLSLAFQSTLRSSLSVYSVSQQEEFFSVIGRDDLASATGSAASSLPTQLLEAIQKTATGEYSGCSVRELLGWFGYAYRTKFISKRIRAALKQLGVFTWPDFTESHLDGSIEFRRLEPSEVERPPDQEPEVESQQSASYDPVPRLAQLAAATASLVTVKRDDPIETAITRMLLDDYSQLPVMQSDRQVDGYISWSSIGAKRALNSKLTFVREAMCSAVPVLPADTHLFEAAEIIAKTGFVLVKGASNLITGIVTSVDISQHLHELAKPFLMIAQIEGHLRALIGRRFNLEEICQARDPADAQRSISDVTDLSFGEAVRFLQSEENWNRLGLPLDRRVMIDRLGRVTKIRNGVMHFRPDANTPADLQLLRKMTQILDSMASEVCIPA